MSNASALTRALRGAIRHLPGAVSLYRRLRPPPEARITRYLAEGARLLDRYGLQECTVTPEGGYFRSPWGAEFVYLPAWGAYGAEHGVLHEEAELELCVRRIPPGGLLVDVGANLGTFCVNLAVRRPDLQVVAFEPVRLLNAHLLRNVRRNALDARVRVERLAVSDRSGEMHITCERYTDNHLVAVGDRASGATEPVPVTTLDGYLAEQGAASPSLLKVDVEGAELQVLRGAQGILEAASPDLLLEVVEEHLARFGDSVAALDAFLSRLGYRRMDVPGMLPHNRAYARERLEGLA